MKKMTKIKLLTLCIGLAQHGYAMESINDDSLSAVTGQDGMIIGHEMTGATINAVNWVDYSDKVANDPNDRKSKVSLQGVEIFGINDDIRKDLWSDLATTKSMDDVNRVIAPATIKTTLEFDVGATSDKTTGIRLAANVSPFHATIKNLMLLCDQPWCTTSSQSLGGLSITTGSDIGFTLTTQHGLFNKNEKAHLDLNLQNMSISHILGKNALTLKDMNFNLVGEGYIYISPDEGIVLESRDNIISLERVADLNDVHASRTGDAATNPGFNIDLRYGQDPAKQKNIMRMGASGNIKNARIALSADQSGLAKFNGVSVESAAYKADPNNQANGYQSSNSGGLHLNVGAEFTRGGTNETKLEIGHTGNGSYAIEFSNLSPLAVRTEDGVVNTQNAYINLGDIYINSLQAKSLNFYVNDNVKKVLGTQDRLTDNIYKQVLSEKLDHTQWKETDQGSNVALVAVRGFDFQSIARQARFISDNSLKKLDNDDTSSWGIGIPIYNLNANVALSEYKEGSKTGLAYNIVASTQGYGEELDASGKKQPKTTSLLIIDGQKGKYSGEEVNYYAGLRNIDAFVDTKGKITYEDEGILISADRLLIAANAELAIGQLPGSRYDCEGCVGYVPVDNFARQDDVITTIAFKLDGKGDLMIIPGVNTPDATADTNFLSFRANFAFNELTAAQHDDENYMGSYFSFINKEVDLTDPTGKTLVGQSSINLNKLQGELGAEARIQVKEDTVVFDNQVRFNPKNNGQFFQGEVALSYTGKGMTDGSMQKIANFALPGGVMRSNLGIKPR